MELAMGARSLLRLLLAVFMLCGHAAAETVTVPGSDMGDTLLDDEDVNIGERRSGVQFTLELFSKVKSPEGCFDTNILEATKNNIKTKLVSDLQEDCKCQPSESLIDRDKIECMTESLMRYSGQISDWSSKTYSVQQLTEFINSWRAQIVVDGGEINFAGGSDLKFTFNITNSQSSVEEFGSGDGTDVEVIESSGDGVTIDINNLKDEDEKEVGKAGGLTSEGQRVRVMGQIVTLFTVFAVVLSFA